MHRGLCKGCPASGKVEPSSSTRLPVYGLDLRCHMRRELYGRGVIGLVKSSHWYQQLQESQQLSLPAMDDAVRVQVPPCAPLTSQPSSFVRGSTQCSEGCSHDWHVHRRGLAHVDAPGAYFSSFARLCASTAMSCMHQNPRQQSRSLCAHAVRPRRLRRWRGRCWRWRWTAAPA